MNSEGITLQPWMLYVMGVVVVAMFIASAFPKILGPVGESWRQFMEGQRATSREADNAAIATRDQQIAYLKGVAAERLREIEARDRLAREHQPWDWERYRAAVKAGHNPDHPPPLFPDVPPMPDRVP